MVQRRLRTALLLVPLALLPAAAAADGASDAATLLEWSRLQARLGIRAASLAPPHDAGSARRLPVQGGHAISAAWSGLKFWARGAGFAVGRRSAGYGVQAGALLNLADDVALTASYRLAGFALGEGLDTELDDVAERTGAPFLGIDLRF